MTSEKRVGGREFAILVTSSKVRWGWGRTKGWEATSPLANDAPDSFKFVAPLSPVYV